MAIDIACGDGELVTSDEIRVYELIVLGQWQGNPGVDSPQMRKLVQWGFVTFHPDRPSVPVALEPQQAARRLMLAELETAQARVARLKALPDLSDHLGEAYARGQWRAGAGSEWIEDGAVVNARLDDVVGGAEWEILACQPGGPRTETQIAGALSRDTAALDRGVLKRTLYRATVRRNSVTAEYVRATVNRTSGKPAEFRTLVGPFERCIIVDRKIAFVSNHLVAGAPEHAAWVITDRAMVAYIAAEFESKWRRADVWRGELETRCPGGSWETRSGVDGVRTTRRQREIMREIVEGRDQKAIAQRLGLGLRTVTAEITELKALLGASSLPGLAYKWALSPDRKVDDSAPDDGETTAA